MDAEHEPYWIHLEPNFARLQMAILRREFLMGQDEIYKSSESDDELSSNND
mgnify:FL=1